jgi:hypothetical protein
MLNIWWSTGFSILKTASMLCLNRWYKYVVLSCMISIYVNCWKIYNLFVWALETCGEASFLKFFFFESIIKFIYWSYKTILHIYTNGSNITSILFFLNYCVFIKSVEYNNIIEQRHNILISIIKQVLYWLFRWNFHRIWEKKNLW